MSKAIAFDMHKYETFTVCTKQALVFAMHTFKVELAKNDQEWLIEEYQLQAFPDVVSGLEALKAQGDTTVALSNGIEATVRTLLGAGVLPYLDGVVSVDDLKTFKL